MIERKRYDLQGTQEDQLEALLTLSAEELERAAGGYSCSYLGVHDWNLMMSYETRNYSC